MTAVVVLLASDIVHRNPVSGMIAHISCDAIMTAQAIVLFMAGVAVGFVPLRCDRMIVKEVCVMDSVCMQAIRFKFPLSILGHYAAGNVGVVASCTFNGSTFFSMTIDTAVHGRKVIPGRNCFVRNLVVAFDTF